MTAAPDHEALLREAIRFEGDGHRALLGGDAEAARLMLREAAEAYRASWEAAPPRAFGRLIGMLKAAVIAGGGVEEARYAREQLGEVGDSPPSWYALAIAALLLGDDDAAVRAAEGMREGSPAFVRTAEAIAALAHGDDAAYAAAVRAIVEDFEGRDAHLTGVPIADTALMLEELAARRGMAARPISPLLPA